MTEKASREGRVALVTGAASGIGAAIAARLIRDGWQVVGADTAEPIKPAAGLRQVQADVSDPGAVASLIDGIAAREGRLDALVSNAGIMIRKPIAELSPEEWSRVIATNLTATYLLVRAAEIMLRQAKGAVVTIASTRARMSEPHTESYAAAKGGLVALTHALAISLGPDVRVNVISPGWIDVREEQLRPEDHAQHPAGRVGKPDDVASLAAFLLDEANGFITGADCIIDGGMTRKMIYAH
jgi:NAD(P)-dependent dehydrogenase (short-subunit alcohol dehydrogenase family)